MTARRAIRQQSTLWQHRFWEHTIRDDTDLVRHIDYIHWNPVKHGYVKRAVDWPYSSFHRYVKQGLLPADWAEVEGIETEDDDDFGE
jgi:putative transposase